MRLTLHTDYALRSLIYLAAAGEAGGTASSIAARYKISENHLRKVMQKLVALGFVKSARGRGGGLHLSRSAAEIIVGDVVRGMEETLDVVECWTPATNTCPIIRACGLKGVLGEALDAFFAVLDRQTLADISQQEARLRRLLTL
jgi:Rrf2 family nitric oxide-sensitive transcriptional repressor